MSRPPPPRPTQAWSIFGRWRRPSPAGRAIGVALLLLALLLTVWWAREPRGDLEEPARSPDAAAPAWPAARPAPAGAGWAAGTAGAGSPPGSAPGYSA